MIKQSVAELRGCAPRETQPATFDAKNATTGATGTQPDGIKSLALQVLRRNSMRNQSATAPATGGNSGATVPCNEETAIRTWLTHIGENDSAILDDVLDRCRNDVVARAYFLRRAEESLTDAIGIRVAVLPK